MVPVIVLGGEMTALGVLRIFGRRGIPAFVISRDGGLAKRSRWYRALPGLAAIPTSSAELSEALTRLPLERAVLCPCSDHWARMVAELPERLRRRFPCSIPSAATMSAFLDKGDFAALLDHEDIPHPFTRLIHTLADLDSVPDDLFASLFLKPRDSEGFWACFGVKAYHARSRDEATQRFQQISRQGFSVVLQQYIPGPTSNQYLVDGFIDRDGRVRALFTRRKLRMYPPYFGNPSYQVSIALSEVKEAVASACRLLEAARYRGVFSAEFKVDPSDGQFKILEVNARPWWYVEFTASCGVDVCILAYKDALGEDLPELGEFEVGKTCIYPYYDFYSVRELWRKGEASWMSWVGELARARQAIFSWDDPAPWTVSVAKMVRKRTRKLLTQGVGL